MVRLSYKGRFGNNIYQYIIGRLIADNIYYPVFNNDYPSGIWYETPKRNIDLYIENRHNKIVI